MKVIYSTEFNPSYTYDPAAAIGRMESVVQVIQDRATFIEAVPATERDIAAVHTASHIAQVRREGLYDIAALAAGGAIQAAITGVTEPCFALIRPPGHHASAESAWGFCYFNNMSIALERLRRDGLIKTAQVLDFDLHFGDGNVNILSGKGYVSICNPQADNRNGYLLEVERFLTGSKVDIIGISPASTTTWRIGEGCWQRRITAIWAGWFEKPPSVMAEDVLPFSKAVTTTVSWDTTSWHSSKVWRGHEGLSHHTIDEGGMMTKFGCMAPALLVFLFLCVGAPPGYP
jgi:hypothetical protein